MLCPLRTRGARVRWVRYLRREVWDGKWPGEADAERLVFFVGGDRSFPDLNRLFRECVWNPDQQRWEQPTRSDGETLH